MRKTLFICWVFSWMCCLTQAQTALWSTHPQYDSLEEYGNLYKIREQGKVGLADITGKKLIPAEYDSITPFYEYFALALQYEKGKYAVKGIINQQTYEKIDIAGQYYITEKYPFFLEDKLVIFDANNKYGYLQTDGTLFKKCQYYKTYPFYEGLACVHKKKGEIAYLRENGTELSTQLETEGYILVSGTSFNEKGEAFVQAKSVGVKRCIINTSGRILREAKQTGNGKLKNYEFRTSTSANETMRSTSASNNAIQVFSDKNRKGYRTTDGVTVLPAQFSEAAPFREGYAKVKLNGKYGVLKLINNSITGNIDKSVVNIKDGKSEKVSYTLSIPSEYANKKFVLSVHKDQGNGEKIDVSTAVSENGQGGYTFIPSPNKEEKEESYLFELRADELLLCEDVRNVKFNYIVSVPLVLTEPRTTEDIVIDEYGYARANSNNEITIYAVLTNRSFEVLNTTVTIEGNGVETVTKQVSVPPENNIKVSTVIPNVTERKSVEIFVKTSDGVSKSKQIKVKPFI